MKARLVSVQDNGQISIGKEHAGTMLQLDILPEGQILLTPVVVRPKHLEPFYSKETDEKLKKFDKYMADWKEPDKGEDAAAGMKRGKK